jgi:phage terminase large subunit
MHSIRHRLQKLLELQDLPESASAEQHAQLQYRRDIELRICAKNTVYWFNTWCWTYNPKLVGVVDENGDRADPWMPFFLFPRQIELVHWIEERSERKEDGHCAKSRDIGFTWVCGGIALKKWLFQDGYKANFGSRKGEYVDRLGDPDSILEKIRLLRKRLPHWMVPSADRMSDNSMLMINEDRGSIIRGESGDDMGRGGRSTDYFFDEFAFVERADGVDAASTANSECRIFGSTVNGMNNLFYRMQAGDRLKSSQKFRFHWTDDPRKSEGKIKDEETGEVMSWERATRRKMEDWKFGSEYDIDYASSVEGICIPAKWVESAKKLRTLVHYEPPRRGVVGGDVGGGGRGKSVAVARFGALVVPPRSWGHGDTIQTAKDMLEYAVDCGKGIPKRRDGYKCEARALNYDSVGVGKGTQDALKRTKTAIVTRGVNTGNPPTETRWPDGATSAEKFANLKAELWNKLRARFKKAHEKVLWLEGDRGAEANDWPIDECIIMPREQPGSTEVTTLCTQLSTVKNESNEVGKTLMQSKKSMAKNGIASPDHADALVLTEAETSDIDVWLKAFGNA